MSDLNRRMDIARQTLAEFKTSEPSASRNAGASDNVFLRYGRMERLLELLVEAYDAEAAVEGGEVARFAADVARLIADYSSEERGVIALGPFTATLNQLCLEKYGFDLDKVAALDTPAQATTDTERTDHA